MAWHQAAGPDGKDGITKTLDTILRGYKDLTECEAEIAVTLAYGVKGETGEVERPALTVRGKPVEYAVTIVPQMYRCLGSPDAVIHVDGDRWNEWSDRKQTAILEEAVAGLLVVRDKEGQVKSDDCGRPKLKKRPPEILVIGNISLIRKYGDDSPTKSAIQDTARQLQMAMDGVAGPTPETVAG